MFAYSDDARPADLSPKWTMWKSRFLSESGRVIDDENGGISHSEGQGFGALLAQAFGDQAAFEKIEAWTNANLMVRKDNLMAWRWYEGRGVQAQDWHTATDGDLFRAWALLRAARDSGWSGTEGQSEKIARDIAALCLRPDPRAPEAPLLIPGAEARSDKDRVLFNPSYIMPRALREIGAAADAPELISAADHGETVLAELAAIGDIPDWIDVTASGFQPPQEHDLRYGYDALRVPLYLVWSGNADHPAVARALETFARADLPRHLAVVTVQDGKVLVQSDLPGYRAIAALPHCVDPATDADRQRQSYYPATLELLAELARQESSHCSSDH